MAKYRRRPPEPPEYMVDEVDALYCESGYTSRTNEPVYLVRYANGFGLMIEKKFFERQYERVEEGTFAGRCYREGMALHADGYIDHHADSPVSCKDTEYIATELGAKCSYEFRANYLCARCGKMIDKSERFIVTVSTLNGKVGRERQAICMTCWSSAPYRCVGCGKLLELGTAFRQQDACGWLCHDCWQACHSTEKPKLDCRNCGKQFDIPVLSSSGTFDKDNAFFCRACWGAQKKPKPLTLADLTPGDVFRLVSHDFCQAKHQLLSAKEFWCSRDRKSITITHPEREVVLIAHHDLIPKQLLWIAASDEERKALDDSIREKWLPRTRGEANSRGRCALCILHDEDCVACLLAKAGDGCNTPSSFWGEWVLATDARWKLANHWIPENQRQYQATRNMALSLGNFLPNIDPTRIEVEATPVEWPGGK